jgi:hypothetical protein
MPAKNEILNPEQVSGHTTNLQEKQWMEEHSKQYCEDTISKTHTKRN